MIRYEHDMLVLDASLSKDDQAAINQFVHEQILKERKRIIDDLEGYTNGYSTLQIAKFKMKQIINNTDIGSAPWTTDSLK